MPESEMEDISPEGCWQLLATARMGRIAMLVRGQPEIFPVNHAVVAGRVLFRTAPGTKLAYAPGAEVCFEIDDYEPELGLGWSVVVHGTAREQTGALYEGREAASDEPRPEAPGVKTHRLVIDGSQVTGRRFRLRF
ncbi:MAG: pyridoxamine 5'-phosphate oxidase family protein [Candidatus Dormibacter sp.]|nr:MAG: hypothetical protein DLM66_09315 [Candidatus Dormibacteraeota bacterium]